MLQCLWFSVGHLAAVAFVKCSPRSKLKMQDVPGALTILVDALNIWTIPKQTRNAWSSRGLSRACLASITSFLQASTLVPTTPNFSGGNYDRSMIWACCDVNSVGQFLGKRQEKKNREKMSFCSVFVRSFLFLPCKFWFQAAWQWRAKRPKCSWKWLTYM